MLCGKSNKRAPPPDKESHMQTTRWRIAIALAAALFCSACDDSSGANNGGVDTSSSSSGASSSGVDTSSSSGASSSSGGDASSSSGGDASSSSGADTSSSGADTSSSSGADAPPMIVTVGEGEACDDPLRECAAGLICAAGACALDEGVCATDSDCQGDTYCFIDGAQAACIPYGDGPRGEVNDECTGQISIGLMEARTQCEWAPQSDDAFPDHRNVLTTPLVADLPNDSGAAAEIIIVSYNFTDGGSEAAAGSNPSYYGVIRVLNGQNCEVLENIDDPENRIIASSPPAIADLDGDGDLEIVAQRAVSGLIAFTWSEANGRFERYWVSSGTDISGVNRWDGPSLHDLDDDGLPEVISGGEVYSGQTGARVSTNAPFLGSGAMTLSVVADIDGDGHAEHLGSDIQRWDRATNAWVMAYPGGDGQRHYGYADFGTPGATPAEFDATTLDGVAEIVETGDNAVQLWTLDGQLLLDVGGISGGGPPTIGDFDNDGFPEIATAGGLAFRVLDLDCADPSVTPSCTAPYVRWQQQSQDASSRMTGSVIFDFEGDGKAEAVYADECFTRIYEGDTGEVLYSSFRTSCTWYENPVIADPDRDSNTEILVGSNDNCGTSCPEIDPIQIGLKCEQATDCLSGTCDEGYCRCVTHDDCDNAPTDLEKQYHCTAPLSGTPGTGNVCRAYHPPGVGLTGIHVLRDRLDRWASSRPMWNQHVYTVTNILDDGKVPSTSTWLANFAQAGLNNFRQNVQGDTGSTDFPDITGRIDKNNACRLFEGGEVRLVATVCNRGNRGLGADMPATFYAGDPADNNIICVSYTEGPVPIGGCLEVSCAIASDVEGVITMVVNDDGAEGQTTVECNVDNNFDSVEIEPCVLF